MDILFGEGDEALDTLLRVGGDLRNVVAMDAQENVAFPCPGGGTARRISAVRTELDLETINCVLSANLLNGRIVVRPITGGLEVLADRLAISPASSSGTIHASFTGDLSSSFVQATSRLGLTNSDAREMSVLPPPQVGRQFRLREYAARHRQFPVGASETRTAWVESRNPRLGTGTTTYTLSYSGPDGVQVTLNGNRSAARLVAAPSDRPWTPAETTRLFRLTVDADGDGVFETDLGDISYQDLLALI